MKSDNKTKPAQKKPGRMRSGSQELNDLIDYIHETGVLKLQKRTGWWVAGVKDPESVAEHSQRSSIIAYIIAKTESADPAKSALMCMIHDIPETRTTDLNKIASSYISGHKDAESRASKDQNDLLPAEIKSDFNILFGQFQENKTKEAIIAKDADYLECAFQAKEYFDLGFPTQDWLDNIRDKLITDTALKMFNTLITRDSKEWFNILKSRIGKSQK